MLIYLAGKPEDHAIIAKYGNDLREFAPKFGLNVTIVSKWHDNANFADDISESRRIRQNRPQSMDDLLENLNHPKQHSNELLGNLELDIRLEAAMDECRKGLDLADTVLADMNGGAVEAGYAIARGKNLLTVGEVQSPLASDSSAEIRSFDSWTAAIGHLTGPIGRFRHQMRLAKE